VRGIRQNDATHHNGNKTKATKKNQAWIGLPGSPSCANLRDQPVLAGCLGGFLGSFIWNVLSREMLGAWGDIKALMGREIWDMLVLEGVGVRACIGTLRAASCVGARLPVDATGW
jgi:hypothetical protein